MSRERQSLDGRDTVFSVLPPQRKVNRKFSFATLAQKVMLDQRTMTGSRRKSFGEQLAIGKWEKEKTELKTKIEELEEFKEKYEEERKTNQGLQEKINRLLQNQSDAGQKLFKSNELVDKLRTDNKKKVDQIEKLQRELRYMEDRLRNLEIRASEVEKAELILETTKSNLESSQIEVRDKEHHIKKLNTMYDDMCKQKEQAEAKIKELEEKALDLKYQVRHELMKNENIEKNLEMIPRLKDDIADKGKEIDGLKLEIEDKTALLLAARKAVREYKEQNREMEQQAVQVEKLREELELAQVEVTTLKQLIHGKNNLVMQKSKALDVAKEVISTMNLSTDPDQMEKILQLLNRIGSPSTTATNSSICSSSSEFDPRSPSPYVPYARTRNCSTNQQYQGIDVNRNPYCLESDHGRTKRPFSSGGLLDNVWNDLNSNSEELQPRTAIVHPVKRSQSFKETSHNKGQIVLLKRSEGSHKGQGDKRIGKGNTSFEYTIGLIEECQNNNNNSESSKAKRNASFQVSKSNSTFSPRSRTRSTQSLSDESCASSSEYTESDEKTMEVVEMLSSLTPKEREEILDNYINIGDRIYVSVAHKPPKYGKKMPSKPKTYTGIVKYRGNLDRKGYDPRIYIGVRLDTNNGDTDGVLKGKRYMYTPSDQGKFFKMLDVHSVLNVKNGKYKPVSALLSQHFLQRLKSPRKT